LHWRAAGETGRVLANTLALDLQDILQALDFLPAERERLLVMGNAAKDRSRGRFLTDRILASTEAIFEAAPRGDACACAPS
jgi:hypothetical protein